MATAPISPKMYTTAEQVPAQITAAGVNAVLVAPQFAVNAADSSAGKFWEPNGFKRFLDEVAIQLARGNVRRSTQCILRSLGCRL